jgi:hypothetical protein
MCSKEALPAMACGSPILSLDISTLAKSIMFIVDGGEFCLVSLEDGMCFKARPRNPLRVR